MIYTWIIVISFQSPLRCRLQAKSSAEMFDEKTLMTLNMKKKTRHKYNNEIYAVFCVGSVEIGILNRNIKYW